MSHAGAELVGWQNPWGELLQWGKGVGVCTEKVGADMRGHRERQHEPSTWPILGRV